MSLKNDRAIMEWWSDRTTDSRKKIAQRLGFDEALAGKRWSELPEEVKASLRNAEMIDIGTEFSAFDNLTEKERAEKITQAGHHAQFAARWATQKFETLPEDVRTLFSAAAPAPKQPAREAQDRLKPGGKFSAKFASDAAASRMLDRIDAVYADNEERLNLPQWHNLEYVKDTIEKLVKAGLIPAEARGMAEAIYKITEDAEQGRFKAKFASIEKMWNGESESIRSDVLESNGLPTSHATEPWADLPEKVRKALIAEYGDEFSSGAGAKFASKPNPAEVAAHWNEKMNTRERKQWLHLAGDDPSLWTKDWEELPSRTRESILAGANEGALTGNFAGVSAGLATAKGNAAPDKPVLLGDKDKPKPTDSGQPGSEALPPKPAAFSATIPTDTGEETKQFDSDEEAVKFLAGQGHLNDIPRALRRLRSTGKWSAASKARIETIEK